ncbi:hypothetical protein [Bacillus cereus group sp. BfR-BA-01313]|uniref:hypothetical protein n=1 Tax=Bacillus cereus group sp. BfR-BA-01313 TaxID=2920290 RepID=UPI001F5A8442
MKMTKEEYVALVIEKKAAKRYLENLDKHWDYYVFDCEDEAERKRWDNDRAKVIIEIVAADDKLIKARQYFTGEDLKEMKKRYNQLTGN